MAIAPVVLLLSLACWATGSPQDDLCYKIRYRPDGSGYTRSQLVRPITKFPAHHAKVLLGVCGQTDAGSPIPEGRQDCTNCRWSRCGEIEFDKCSPKSDCITPPYSNCDGDGLVNAGSLFYAYDYPIGHSSNTGYSEFETSMSYFVTDSAGQTWFVLSHDKPDNADGGTARLTLRGNRIQDAYVAQMDDPGEFSSDESACDEADSDCYAWDSVRQSGEFVWRWGSCCTDGMVFGPLPSHDFDMTLQFQQMSGIASYKFGSYHAENATLDFEELTLSDMSAGVLVEGFTCNDYCSSLKSCGACAMETACAWCTTPNGTQGCVSNEAVVSVEGCVSVVHDACCDACHAFADCDACSQHTTDLGCGWCSATGSCLSGTDQGACRECADFIFGTQCPVAIAPTISAEPDQNPLFKEIASTITWTRSPLDLEANPSVVSYDLLLIIGNETRLVDTVLLTEENYNQSTFTYALTTTSDGHTTTLVRIEAKSETQLTLGFAGTNLPDLARPNGSIVESASTTRDVATAAGVLTMSVVIRISDSISNSDNDFDPLNAIVGYRLYAATELLEETTAALLATILESEQASGDASSNSGDSNANSRRREFKLVGAEVDAIDTVFVVVPFTARFEAAWDTCVRVELDDVEGLNREAQIAITSVAVAAAAVAVASTVVTGAGVVSSASVVSSVAGTDPVILASNFQNIGAMSQIQIDTLPATTRDFCASLAWSNGDLSLFSKRGHVSDHTTTTPLATNKEHSSSYPNNNLPPYAKAIISNNNSSEESSSATLSEQQHFLLTGGRTPELYFREIATGFILVLGICVIVTVAVSLFVAHRKSRRVRGKSLAEDSEPVNWVALCQSVVVAVMAVFYFGLTNATMLVLWRGGKHGQSDMIAAYIALVFIVVGLPGLIAFDMRRASRPNCTPAKRTAIQDRYKFLTTSLNPEHSMYAVLNLVRRFGMGASVVFLVNAPMAQCVVFCVSYLVMFAVVVKVQPFKGGRKSITFCVECLFQLTHTTTCAIPIAYKLLNKDPTNSATVLISLQLVVIVLSFVSVCAALVSLVKAKRNNRHHPSTTSTQTSHNQSTSSNASCNYNNTSNGNNRTSHGRFNPYPTCAIAQSQCLTPPTATTAETATIEIPTPTPVVTTATPITVATECSKAPKASVAERATAIVREFEEDVPGITAALQSHVTNPTMFRVCGLTLQLVVLEGQLMHRVGGGYESMQSWLARHKPLIARAIGGVERSDANGEWRYVVQVSNVLNKPPNTVTPAVVAQELELQPTGFQNESIKSLEFESPERDAPPYAVEIQPIPTPMPLEHSDKTNEANCAPTAPLLEPFSNPIESSRASVSTSSEPDDSNAPATPTEPPPNTTTTTNTNAIATTNLLGKLVNILLELEAEVPGIRAALHKHVKSTGMFRIGSVTLLLFEKDGQLWQRVGRGSEELRVWLERRKATVKRAVAGADSFEPNDRKNWTPV